MKSSKLILATTILALGLVTPAFAENVTVVVGAVPPPPPPIVEAIPVAPGPAELYAWHAGHWRWIDDRHLWVPGHWSRRPHPTAQWVEPTWEHVPEGYHFHEGHWEDHEEHH